MSSNEHEIRLYADPSWTEESSMSLSLVFGMPIETALEEIQNRRELLVRAEQLGITVVRASVEPDEFFDGYIASGKDLDRADEESLLRTVVSDIAIPKSVDFEAYDAQPFFPAVAKNHGLNAGMHKYLIEQPEQWAAMRRLLAGDPVREISVEDQTEYQKVQRDARQVFTDFPEGTPEHESWKSYLTSWNRYIADYQNPAGSSLQDFFEYHQFIETPSDHFTSYRVLTSASGAILASTLYYSDGKKSDFQPRSIDGDITKMGQPGDDAFDFLLHPESLAYVGSRSFQSNKTTGGHGIVLDPTSEAKPRSAHENEILAAHGLSTKHPELPEKIRVTSSTIAKTIGPRLGVVVGIDWIQEDTTGAFHYLETNSGPGALAYADAYYERYKHVSERRVSHDMHLVALETLTR